MTDLCCGEYRTTNFCPECGIQLDGSPLRSLLRHIEGVRVRLKKEQETTVAKIASLKADGEVDRARREKVWGERRLTALERWTQWRDALKELMEKQES